VLAALPDDWAAAAVADGGDPGPDPEAASVALARYRAHLEARLAAPRRWLGGTPP
jgi:hypothetical protein